MPRNSSRTTKTKRTSSKSRVKTKKNKRKLKAEQIAEEAKKAFSQIENNKNDDIPVSKVVPVELITREELKNITKENSFILNPLLANASLQKDLAIATNRIKDLQALHDHLFDVRTLNAMDDKSLVSLYSVAISDHHKIIQEKIKIAEISDKNRILREASKYYAELEKRKEIEASDESHTTEVIQALLTESMRQAMDDEIRKKWNGSNTYRPPENTNYEILAIDPNADK